MTPMRIIPATGSFNFNGHSNMKPASAVQYPSSEISIEQRRFQYAPRRRRAVRRSSGALSRIQWHVSKALSTEKLIGIYGHIAKRYDFQHALITFRADQKGRKIPVENSVNEGDEVLDCGSGTGTTPELWRPRRWGGAAK